MTARKIGPYADTMGVIMGGLGLLEVGFALLSGKLFLFIVAALFGLIGIRTGRMTGNKGAIVLGGIALASAVLAGSVHFLA